MSDPTESAVASPTGATTAIEQDVAPGGAGRASVRVIATWEAVKGVLVLLAAGLATYLLRPEQEESIDEIVGHFHLNPAGHTSHVFQQALAHAENIRIDLLALGALLYATLRFVEAYGLWAEKRWGWILGIASAALYLPLEVREFMRHFSYLSIALFAVNLVIVLVLWRNRTHHVVRRVA